MTCDDAHVWLAPFTPGALHTVTIQLDAPATLGALRVWNYNKSRIHSLRGARCAAAAPVAAGAAAAWGAPSSAAFFRQRCEAEQAWSLNLCCCPAAGAWTSCWMTVSSSGEICGRRRAACQVGGWLSILILLASHSLCLEARLMHCMPSFWVFQG